MANTVSGLGANARIYVLVDDYLPETVDVNPQKSFYKINSFTSVNCMNSIEGGGNASITFNDKDLKFEKYYPFAFLNTKDYGDERLTAPKTTTKEEISEIDKDREPLPVAFTDRAELEMFKRILTEYGEKQDALKAIQVLASTGGNTKQNTEKIGGVLTSVFSPMNLIWIDALGRDGRWYRRFSGIVSSIGINDVPNQTPTISLKAVAYDKFLKLAPIVTGTPHIGSNTASEQLAVSGQAGSLSFVNKYGGKFFNEIVVDVFKESNKFWLQKNFDEVKDFRYFKVNNIFGFGEKEEDIKDKDGKIVDAKYAGEKGYAISDDKFRNKSWKWDEKLKVGEDFYPGREVIRKGKQVNSENNRDWIDVIMADDFFGDKKPFQNLVRTHLSLFNIDKMTAWDILNEIRKTVMCYIYPDVDGTFKIERPYFDISLAKYYGVGDASELVPPDYDLRYVISEKDRSYISSGFEENETPIVTRTELQSNVDFINFSPELNKIVLQGKSESSLKMLGRYGDRQIILKSIVTQKFNSSDFPEEVLNAYCYCQKLLLNTESKTFTITLNQRPDIQLNRNMVFLDRGICFITHTISDSFTPNGTHTTTIRGKFVRHVGFRLINPWRFRIKRSTDGTDTESQSGYALEEWPEIKPIDFSKSENILGIGSSIIDTIGYVDGSETYDKIVDEIKNQLNTTSINPESVSFDENKLTLLVLRQVRKGKITFDDFNKDIFYLVYKDESGVGQFRKFFGSSGDPQCQGTYWRNKNRDKYTKLIQGAYRYKNLETGGMDGNNKQNFVKLSCDNFKYKIINGQFEDDSDLILDSKDKKVKSKNSASESFKSFLSRNFISYYGDEAVAYDSSQIIVESDDINTVLPLLQLRQTYLDVIIADYSLELRDKLQVITNANATEVDYIFLYLYLIQTNSNNLEYKTGKNNLQLVKFTQADISFDNTDVSPSQPDANGMYGLYKVTKDFTDLDDKKWREFLTSESNQRDWFNSFYRNKLEHLLARIPNVDYILNNLAVSYDNSIKQETILYTTENDILKDFPMDGIRNNKAGMIALLHLSVQKLMLRDSGLTVGNMLDSMDSIYEIMNSYYLLNSWTEEDAIRLRNFKQISIHDFVDTTEFNNARYTKLPAELGLGKLSYVYQLMDLFESIKL